MGTYALIKPINSVETIDTVIVASPEVAATYLVANEGAYDYAIDIAEFDPVPGIGWTYDPGMSEFSAPPEDFEGELTAALIAVDTAVENAVMAYLAVDSEDRGPIIGNVLSELSEVSSQEMDVLAALVTLLQFAAGE